ncbi:MAG: radical SAM protein [Deltaproteobacteria bacterium]
MGTTVSFSLCYLILTEDCNLRCKYCYENANRCSNSYMSVETAKQSADFLFDNALKHGIKYLNIIFFGGEPLLNLDVMTKFFFYATEKANQYNIKIWFLLITNGTIYNTQYEKFILQWYKTINNVSIQISTDGIPEVQDKNRRTIDDKPTSKIVSGNILKLKAFLKQNKIEANSFYTHFVLTKESIPKIFSNYKYFRHLGINHIEFMMSYNESWEEEDIPEYIEQLSLIADSVYDECIKACSLIPYENAYLLIGLRPVEEKYKERVLKECTIAPNGDIYSFTNMYFNNRNYKIGNVFDGVLNNNIEKTFFDICHSSSLVDDDTCFNCENTQCNKYMKSNRLRYDEAKKTFEIETKKRFDQLSDKLNYRKCNEAAFFQSVN